MILSSFHCKKQEFYYLENLIKEVDERHNKVIEEMMEHNAKALEEFKLLIVGIAIHSSDFPASSQVQVPNGEARILVPNLGYNGTMHYTKLEFLIFI